MIALYNFTPLYCPSCGSPTRLDRSDNLDQARFNARQALACPICGLMFQKATKKALFRAAAESEGDLMDYYLDDDQDSRLKGKGPD